MLPPRILGLLVILLAVQGLCKPATKSTEDMNYEDDTPFEDEDEEEEVDDTDNTANNPPQILSKAESFRALAGSTIILPCDVIHTENYAIAWFKDNKYLYVESQPHVDEEDAERIVRLPNNSLAIYNATVNDSSNNYKCSILRQPDSLNIIHRVLIDPVRSHKQYGIIRVVPANRIDVHEGQYVQFGCEIDVQPSPEIKWYIENAYLKSYDPNVHLEGNYIEISKVNRTHSGLYQCLAEDGSKMPAMEAITLSVLYPPEVEAKKKMVHTGTGVESELTCIVSAYPSAIITWWKDDREILHKKGSVTIHHEAMKKSNKTKHVLKILRTSAQDFGNYKCNATNSMGSDSKSISLSGTPSQAKISGAEMTNDDAKIILKWSLESYSPIDEYKLEYRRKGDEKWHIVTPEVKNGKGKQFTVEHPIEELQPGSYEAILKARNQFGWSPPSEPHMFTGDYPPEMARKEDSAAIQIRSSGTLLALILVVLSCAFTSL